MGRKSSIDRLPAEIKAYIERRLGEGRLTLDELIADLQAAFPSAAAGGELPSRTAVHRYGQKLERRLAAIRASTEAAKIIQANAGDDQDARSEALTALIQTELFEAILDIQDASSEDVDPAERVGMLSTAAKNIATLTRSSVNLKKFQAEVREDTAKKASLEAVKVAKAQGLSDEVAELIRQKILGVV